MPSDLFTEGLVPLRDAAHLLGGRRVHASSLHRWRNRGVRGIKLEAVRVGGTWCTSPAAMRRFVSRLSGPDPMPPARRSPRERKGNPAGARLDALGY
jgi:hypothetical protein